MTLERELADVVVSTVHRALAPALAEVKALRMHVAGWETRWADLGALRERVAVVEATKALPLVETRPAADETVLLRLTALETNAGTPGRDGKDGLPGEKGLDGAMGAPGAPGPIGPAGPAGNDGAPGERGAAGVQGPQGERGGEGPGGPPGRDGRDGTQGIQGGKGMDGMAGRDGMPGQDGTLENLKVLYDGERTLTFCRKDGTPIEGGPIHLPIEIWRGVYLEGKTYDQYDTATWGGSEWRCNETTVSKPGDGSKAWTLKVKRGRDGRDGKDAPSLPVVSVGGPR